MIDLERTEEGRLALETMDWHGGMGTATYALASHWVSHLYRGEGYRPDPDLVRRALDEIPDPDLVARLRTHFHA
jgi:hypothetical protein